MHKYTIHEAIIIEKALEDAGTLISVCSLSRESFHPILIDVVEPPNDIAILSNCYAPQFDFDVPAVVNTEVRETRNGGGKKDKRQW